MSSLLDDASIKSSSDFRTMLGGCLVAHAIEADAVIEDLRALLGCTQE